MICLDANCVIYLVEKNPHWGPKVVARLAAAKAAGESVAVSDLARAECLPGPLRSGDAAVMADYQRFFASPAVQMLPITPAVCEKAAEVRVASAQKIKLPDALYLAAAIVHGCGLFLTKDPQLQKCAAITVEVLT
jgi:predicted nucleic acid-binding protein